MPWIKRLYFPILAPVLISGAVIGSLQMANYRNTFKGSTQQLLLVTPSVARFDGANRGDVLHAAYAVQNVSSKSVKLLGANTSCGCTTVEDEFPFELSPGAKTTIHIQISIGDTSVPGRFTKAVRLLVDQKGVVPLLVVQAEISK